MRKKIKKMLSAYEKADAMTAMKARFIFYLCLAIGAVLTAAVVYTSILHLNNPAYGYRVRVPVLVPMLTGLAMLLLIMGLLRRGRFRTASHLLMTGAFIVIWSIIINDRGDPLARLDTIIFIAAIIALTPLIVVGKGYSIAVYTLLNIAAMYLFMLVYHPGLDLSKHSIWEYLADNTSAMLFIAVISYAIFTINRRTFSQTVRLNTELFRKNEELEATNEELQATIEELEATNEEFEAQNEELIAAENDLRQSEEKYRGLVENINEVIYSIDETGNILYMSPGIEKMTGFTLEEMAGENYTRFIHPDDLSYLINDFDELSHGVIKPSEYRVKTKTGEYVWIMTASRPTFKNGRFAGATGVMTGIHKRRLAEETLRESEERLRAIGDNLPGGMIYRLVTDTEGDVRFTHVSAGVERLHGLSAEQVLADASLLYRQIHEDDIGRVKQEEVVAVKNLSTFDVEARFRLPSGGTRWYRMISQPRKLENGETVTDGIELDVTERKIAEEELRQREELFRIFTEEIIAGVTIIDRDGRITVWNRAAESISGIGREAALGKYWWDVAYEMVPPPRRTEERRRELERLVKKALDEGVPAFTGAAQFAFATPDGREKTAEQSVFPIATSKGVIFATTFLDVTERIRAEETLRESEEKYRGLVENINEIVYSTDSRGAVSYVSPSITKTIDMAPEEIVGRSFFEFIYPEDREYLLSRFQRVVEGIFEPTEYRLALPSGQYRWVRSNSRPLYADGVFQGVSGIITDIHERKMAEQKTLQEKAFADAIIDTLPGIFFIIDGEGRLIRWKGRGAGDEAFGYTPEEVKRMSALDMVYAPEREPVAEQILRVFTEGQADTEVTFVRKNGERIIFHIAASRMTLDEKDYIIGIGFEITDRKRAEKERERIQAQLVQAQKLEAVGTLAGGIAHDFNNMLGGIMGSLNLVELLLGKDEPPRKETLLKYIDTAMESSRRAAEITRQLLTLSRPMELQSAPVDIGISLKNVLKIGKNSFPKSVILDFHIPEKPVMVYGDPTQIEQMLLNLCVNASHAMTIMRGKGELPGGTLLLKVDETAWDGAPPAPHPDALPGTAYARVGISDTGVGMDSDTKKRVFEPFFTTKQRGEGTGLGLSMVYSIVKLHRGYIDVRSKPGAGSTFTVHLPLMEKPPEEKQRNAAAGGLLRGTGTVLVVDDEKALLRIAKGMLEQCGYRVITAEGGQAGTEVFAREHGEIDAVFLDLSMPGVSGLEVYERMREVDPEVRVLLTSGLIEDDTLKKALERGIRGFLQKPYSAEELSAKMKEILSA